MDAVAEVERRVGRHAFEEEGIEHEAFALRKFRKDRIELVAVVAPEIGRRIHAGEEDGQAARLRAGDDLVEVPAGDAGVDGAQRVVGAEFDDDGVGPGPHRPVEAGKAALMDLYRDAYRGEPFVRVVTQPPQTKHTLGNNYCVVYPTIDQRTDRLIVIACLDNLVKGAAGQAVQNANLMLGLPETMGLEGLALYP